MQAKHQGTQRGERTVWFVEEARVWREWGICEVWHHDQKASNDKVSKQFCYEETYGDIPLLHRTQI